MAGHNLQTKRCATVGYTINSGNLTLTCATADAQIFYTTDGSTPSKSGSGNSESKQYVSPLPVESGDVVRVAAYVSGMNKSASRYIVVP
jgi:hypothetical protein